MPLGRELLGLLAIAKAILRESGHKLLDCSSGLARFRDEYARSCKIPAVLDQARGFGHREQICTFAERRDWLAVLERLVNECARIAALSQQRHAIRATGHNHRVVEHRRSVR
jgi:hypothetical protein